MDFVADDQKVWALWKGRWVQGIVIAAMGNTARVQSLDGAEPPRKTAWERTGDLVPDTHFDTWFDVAELRSSPPEKTHA